MTPRTRSGAAAFAVVLLTAATGCAVAEHAADRSAATPGRSGSAERPAAPGGPSAPAPFTLVASGDVLPHDSVIRQAAADSGGAGYDFRSMLSGVRSVVSRADLAICHMETVYGEAGGPYTGYPAFKSPPEVAAALRETGYDSCSTASNHTLDDGAGGLRRTLDALDRAGVRHAGSARTAEEAARPTLLKAGAATVAQLAYTYGTNGYPLPEGQPWAVNLIDEQRILADARAARKAGADVVVVSLHWGTEWQTDPDRRQLTLGRALTASHSGNRPDIDLIIGTHAHVPQAYEKVNGTWIVYGMGDQIAGDMVNYEGAHDPRGNQGTLARFTFAPPTRSGGRWTVSKAEFVPQLFDTARGRVVNLNEAIEKGEARYGGTRDAVRGVVLGRGAARDGLMMGE
ncbi:CapA family protein [Streptomyces sp. NPDC101191]|uniref:CapA family protein n=1 Tax=Streptomyces sp. NPDC101191 TaxID=3366126 RepID=UPI0038198134